MSASGEVIASLNERIFLLENEVATLKRQNDRQAVTIAESRARLANNHVLPSAKSNPEYEEWYAQQVGRATTWQSRASAVALALMLMSLLVATFRVFAT